MNYSEKIRYRIISTAKDDFPVMVDKLLSQLPEDEVIVRLAFFGMPADNDQYVERRAILRDKIFRAYSRREPAISYVAQPPLNGALIMEVHSYKANEDDLVRYENEHNFPYVVIENKKGKFLFAGGFQSDILCQTIEEQSKSVFGMVSRVLEKERIPIENIIRQWNYIENITGYQGENQNYQSFNNARSDYYSKANWNNGYPAATGIGSDLGGVLIDLDAVLLTSPDTFATSIDNKLQIAAHAYSESVLVSAQCQKATPKFERAKSITSENKRVIYISGTAAIRGEESLKGVGLEKQLIITLENIAQLIDNAEPVMLRVYLKYAEDYEEAERLMRKFYPSLPVSFMCADVCREELLIEIEGVAIEQ